MAAVLLQRPVHVPRRGSAWLVFAVVLLVAPWLCGRGAGLSILSQMAITMIFALSYNMLLGQSGMLSFGHGVYSGLGGFVVVHAMNLAGTGQLPVPVTLMPLVGALAGGCFGLLFGLVTTRKSGTTFAMITLGIVELVHAAAQMFPGFFGGDGGVSTNRVVGAPVMGISYGPQIEVYYLIAGWLLVSAFAMHALGQTPLGRMANAVRDNPQRAAFIGYDAQWVRLLTLTISAFFAGIAGGLAAINYEIMTAESVGIEASGTILLFTFIGGAGSFYGPMVGAVVGVLMTVVVAGMSNAWTFYLGLFFIVMVVWAPGGISGLVLALARTARHGRSRRVWPALAMVSATVLVAVTGLIGLTEMLYHRTFVVGDGNAIRLLGLTVDPSEPTPWLVATALMAAGATACWHARRPFRVAWDDAQTHVAEALRQETQ